MIGRRQFILSSIAAVVGLQVPSKSVFNYVPNAAQLKFFSQPDIPMWLYGIPYHQSNASSGEWLGIHREAFNGHIPQGRRDS